MIEPKYLARDWYNARADFERDYITAMIVACNGNLTEVARRASFERGSLYRKMRKLNLHLKDVCANHGLPYLLPRPGVHAARRPAPIALPPPPTGFEYCKGQLKRVLKTYESACQPD